MEITKKIQLEIDEAQKQHWAAKQALDVELPGKIAVSQRAIKSAEDALLIDLSRLCSRPGQAEESSTAKHCEEISKHRLMLEHYPKVEPILKKRFEDAISRANHLNRLLDRARYNDLRNSLLEVPRHIDDELQKQLVGLGMPYKAAEARHLVKEVNEHIARGQRTGADRPFEFKLNPDASDQELEQLGRAS